MWVTKKQHLYGPATKLVGDARPLYIECDAVFGSPESLEKHFANRHHNNLRCYKCTRCGSELKRKSNALRHMKNKHGIIEGALRFFTLEKNNEGEKEQPDAALSGLTKKQSAADIEEEFPIKEFLMKILIMISRSKQKDSKKRVQCFV